MNVYSIGKRLDDKGRPCVHIELDITPELFADLTGDNMIDDQCRDIGEHLQTIVREYCKNRPAIKQSLAD